MLIVHLGASFTGLGLQFILIKQSKGTHIDYDNVHSWRFANIALVNSEGYSVLAMSFSST